MSHALFPEFASLPDLGRYALIVAGGGTAGSAAAITAGRRGVRSLLIEPLSFLGGTGVGAQVTPWMSNQTDMGPLNEGLTAELQRDLETRGDAVDYRINPEALKSLLERKAVDAGVALLFHGTVIALQLDSAESRIASLVIATPQGLYRAAARCIVDATGDAEVARLAGVPCREGREQDGVHQPMSLRFVLGNVDRTALIAWLRDRGGHDIVWEHNGLFGHRDIGPVFLALVRADGWPEKWIKTFSISFAEIAGRPGEIWFNCPRLAGFNPLDPVSLSEAYVEGRRMIDAYLALFRKHVGGAKTCHLVATAPLMGIREGRRIVGQYTLTGDDFRERRKFSDGICLNRYPIDIHNPHGQGLSEWTELPPNDWHEIPYRCLVPESVRGLLVAGRCISSDFSAQASYRIIPNCRTIGEAAGVAVHLAAERQIDVSELDGVAVRRDMQRTNLLPRWFKEEG